MAFVGVLPVTCPDLTRFQPFLVYAFKDEKIGERMLVSLSNGCIEEATVKRIVTGSDSERLQIDLGKDETELIYAWQVRDGRVKASAPARRPARGT